MTLTVENIAGYFAIWIALLGLGLWLYDPPKHTNWWWFAPCLVWLFPGIYLLMVALSE